MVETTGCWRRDRLNKIKAEIVYIKKVDVNDWLIIKRIKYNYFIKKFKQNRCVGDSTGYKKKLIKFFIIFKKTIM